jgi:hypothetical protein
VARLATDIYRSAQSLSVQCFQLMAPKSGICIFSGVPQNAKLNTDLAQLPFCFRFCEQFLQHKLHDFRISRYRKIFQSLTVGVTATSEFRTRVILVLLMANLRNTKLGCRLVA